MQEPDQELDQLAHRVIGMAIEVHRTLGPGYLESVYEQALCLELTEHAIAHSSQALIEVMYKGHMIGQGRIDIWVVQRLIIELKAVEAFTAVHKAQVISYLKTTRCQLGLLINFNVPMLKDGIQRIIYSS